ncbi:MAG TPA: hypothetical protein IAC83_00800 [Euryarchaeota archaeon]|nr:hypothetical protein [Euryarchaeota archaeon]
MNAKQIIAVGAVMLFVVCLLPAVDADTSITDSPRGTIEFDSMNGGDITFTVDSDTSFEMQVSVINESGGATVYTGTYQIHSGENVVTIHFEGLGEGDYYLNVVCSGPSGEFNGPNSFHVNVHVNQNILSNWATYAVIIVVVIVIAIFAYLKLRDNPKDKPQMTFEELEAQRKAEMAEKAEKRQKKEKPASTGTERKRYIGGGEKKAEPKEPAKEKPVKEKKVKEEKPKMTFEELEAQKQAEKAAKAEKKKEKPTSTGLTERERYLAEKRKKKEQE